MSSYHFSFHKFFLQHDFSRTLTIFVGYRSAITIFPQRRGQDTSHDFRVWNNQLISYAGYVDPDNPSQAIGDPLNVEFTQVSRL